MQAPAAAERRTLALEESSEALALILAVQKGLAAGLDSEAIYELVGDRLRSFFDAQAVVIRTFDNGLDHVRYVVEKGRRLRPPPRPITPLLQHLIDTGEPFLWREDVAARLAQYGHPIFDDSEMPKTVLTVPMVVGDVVRGATSLQNVDREYAYDEGDLRLLTALTCSMGQALATAESHIRLRRALDELQNTRDRLLDEQRLRTEAAETLADHLQRENERQINELEEARQFQLSLLPERVPDLASVEVAASMRTATEVGGDYYDFFVTGEDACILAVGDATGHGIRAGAMVTVVKSVLANDRKSGDLVEVLRRASQTVRQVALPGLYMALALGRLKGCVLELVGAGMPPALVVRAATGQVEEVPLKGIPLGGPPGYPYRLHRVVLGEGDTAVLMSDGFAELFDERGEMLGYDRAAEVLRGAQGLAPEVVVRQFMREVEVWAGEGGSSDDVTIVALQAKGEPR